MLSDAVNDSVMMIPATTSASRSPTLSRRHRPRSPPSGIDQDQLPFERRLVISSTFVFEASRGAPEDPSRSGEWLSVQRERTVGMSHDDRYVRHHEVVLI